jgi:hypothetical protein
MARVLSCVALIVRAQLAAVNPPDGGNNNQAVRDPGEHAACSHLGARRRAA